MNSELIITLVITVIGSNALFGFIQYLIQRKDNKNEKYKEILEAIKGLSEHVETMDAEAKETKAIDARIRILKFMDELLEGRRHTKDSYDQCLSDITKYEIYCIENPKFKNNQTVSTVEYIKKDYQKRLEKHDFL